MGFIIGENLNALLQRIAYRGCIGIFYNSTIGGILAFVIFGLIALLSLIGLLTVVHFFLGKNQRSIRTTKTTNASKSSLTPEESKWLYGKR